MGLCECIPWFNQDREIEKKDIVKGINSLIDCIGTISYEISRHINSDTRANVTRLAKTAQLAWPFAYTMENRTEFAIALIEDGRIALTRRIYYMNGEPGSFIFEGYLEFNHIDAIHGSDIKVYSTITLREVYKKMLALAKKAGVSTEEIDEWSESFNKVQTKIDVFVSEF